MTKDEFKKHMEDMLEEVAKEFGDEAADAFKKFSGIVEKQAADKPKYEGSLVQELDNDVKKTMDRLKKAFDEKKDELKKYRPAYFIASVSMGTPSFCYISGSTDTVRKVLKPFIDKQMERVCKDD